MPSSGVPPHELAWLIEGLLVFLTSSDPRRFGQWENVSWWDFVGAETRSPDYQHVLAAGLTRNLVAAKETIASTRTIGTTGEAFVYNIMGRGNDGALDRVLDLPTNEAWLHPSVRHLTGLGVRFVRGQRLAAYDVGSGGRIRAVLERCRAAPRPVPGAHARAAHGLDGRHPVLPHREVDLTHGHLTFIDSPWALTGVTQAQFWTERDFAQVRGHRTAAAQLPSGIVHS